MEKQQSLPPAISDYFSELAKRKNALKKAQMGAEGYRAYMRKIGSNGGKQKQKNKVEREKEEQQ